MRPDRLVVGECRGAEVRELLTAMNTGHTGGGGTIHANTASAVPARLTALGALAGLGQDAVRLQVASALDVVVHVARRREGRHVACVGLLQQTAGTLGVSTALEDAGGQLVAGPAWETLAGRLGMDPAPIQAAVFRWSSSMIAVLVVALALALWLILRPPRGVSAGCGWPSGEAPSRHI